MYVQVKIQNYFIEKKKTHDTSVRFCATRLYLIGKWSKYIQSRWREGPLFTQVIISTPIQPHEYQNIVLAVYFSFC